MTKFITAAIGSYPRIGEDKDQQRYRRGYTNHENREISDHAFNDVTQSVIQEVIREQVLCGMDEVTDGLISWKDPISHFCKNVSGIKTAGLERYFDNNFYYRQPVFYSKPKLRGPIIAGEFEFAKKTSPKPVRAVLTGPLTLAVHTRSEIKTFEKLASRMSFFSELIEQEVNALMKVGAATIQIDEPALGLYPKECKPLLNFFEKIKKSTPITQIILALYFSPLSDLYATLCSWPLGGLQLDLTCDEKALTEKILKQKPPFEIGLGLVNARTSQSDDFGALHRYVRTYVDKHTPERLILSPSTGLELLPRAQAAEKLNLLSKLKTELTGSPQPVPLHA